MTNYLFEVQSTRDSFKTILPLFYSVMYSCIYIYIHNIHKVIYSIYIYMYTMYVYMYVCVLHIYIYTQSLETSFSIPARNCMFLGGINKSPPKVLWIPKVISPPVDKS